MASSLGFFTTENMIDAVCLSATSEATGFNKERLLDSNPQTAWKATSTADQTVTFDFGEAKAVDIVFVMIRNYRTDFNDGTASILFEGSSDNISWSPAGGVVISHDEATQQPIVFAGLNSFGLGGRRYWRITFSDMINIMEVSGVYFCRSYGISVGAIRPLRRPIRFRNRRSEYFAQAINRDETQAYFLTYMFPNETNMAQLRAAFRASKGDLLHMIVAFDGDLDTSFLCRFGESELDDNEIDYLCFNPSFSLEPIYYIRDGQVY